MEMPPPLSSSAAATEDCQDLCVLHDTEGKGERELVFFLTISVGSTKPKTKKVLLAQHSGENTGFVLRWTWV